MGNASNAQSAERVFGNRMRRERLRRGWRQEDLAAKATEQGLTLHPSAYAKMEAGSRPVRLNEAVAITAAFGLPVGWMVSGDDTDGPQQQLERIREELRGAIAESDDSLQRAATLWLEQRRLIRELAGEGQMAITPADEEDGQ